MDVAGRREVSLRSCDWTTIAAWEPPVATYADDLILFSPTTTAPPSYTRSFVYHNGSDSEDNVCPDYGKDRCDGSETIPLEPRIEGERLSPLLHFSLFLSATRPARVATPHLSLVHANSPTPPRAPEGNRQTLTVVRSAYLLKGVKDSP